METPWTHPHHLNVIIEDGLFLIIIVKAVSWTLTKNRTWVSWDDTIFNKLLWIQSVTALLLLKPWCLLTSNQFLCYKKPLHIMKHVWCQWHHQAHGPWNLWAGSVGNDSKFCIRTCSWFPWLIKTNPHSKIFQNTCHVTLYTVCLSLKYKYIMFHTCFCD